VNAAAAPRRLVVGVGGTTRPGSSSELALRAALGQARRLGADTQLFTAHDLQLPMYDPATAGQANAGDLLGAMRRADAVIISSPGYHGGISGLIKNALDYLQELAGDAPPYLDGRPVGCLVTAAGWQAGVTTLAALRNTVHALRGWPSPLGVVVNSAEPQFDEHGDVLDPRLSGQLATLAEQVVGFLPAVSLTRRGLGQTVAAR
jgi:FMN reductase